MKAWNVKDMEEASTNEEFRERVTDKISEINSQMRYYIKLIGDLERRVKELEGRK